MGCVSSKKEVTATVQTVARDNSNTLHTESTLIIRRVEDLKIHPGQFIQRLAEPFASRYRIMDELGTGNFGKVYKAEKKGTREIRAVKEIDKRRAEKLGGSHTKFITEVEIISHLDHPNIIKIYEMFEDQSRYYVVSELCSGGELFDYIATRKHLSESMAAGIIRQVLSAVAYCHEHHIVHRDLKPENLLLDAPPTNKDAINIKVIDFGTSCLCSENERLRKKLGTAYYIAPEVLNMSYNEKCDIWSCGVILYILLSGYPPFSGQTDEEIMRKVKVGKFNFAHENWRQISDSAKQLIKRMLTMNPAARPSAMDCLQTPWLQMMATSAEKTAPNVMLALNNLESFHHTQKLRQAFLGFITAQLMNKEHEQQLALEFRALDKNGDGKLSREELLEAYKSSMPLAQAEDTVEQVMRQVDFDGSGFIDYSEFIAACANQETLLSKANLKTAFDAFDKDHSGKISAHELKVMLDREGAVREEVWLELIRQADLNGDGEIEYEEFARLMLEAAR